MTDKWRLERMRGEAYDSPLTKSWLLTAVNSTTGRRYVPQLPNIMTWSNLWALIHPHAGLLLGFYTIIRIDTGVVNKSKKKKKKKEIAVASSSSSSTETMLWFKLPLFFHLLRLFYVGVFVRVSFSTPSMRAGAAINSLFLSIYFSIDSNFLLDFSTQNGLRIWGYVRRIS